jgi:organic radical activating enzyme
MNEKMNLTVLMTSKCNLKCKLCATYSSTHPNPQHYNLEEMKKAVNRFFEVFDEVKLFTLSGGEPLLHPNLTLLVEHFLTYIDRVSKFEIITNGTVLPSDELLKCLQISEKVDILIDDYGKGISRKVDEISRKFTEHNIKHRIRKYHGNDAHYGGWLDISDFSDKRRSNVENQDIFRSCLYTTKFKNHIFIINGTAHMCYVNFQLLPHMTKVKDEYVDLQDDSLSVNDIRRKIFELRNRKQLSVCSQCNGFCEDAKRYPPAEQL